MSNLNHRHASWTHLHRTDDAGYCSVRQMPGLFTPGPYHQNQTLSASQCDDETERRPQFQTRDEIQEQARRVPDRLGHGTFASGAVTKYIYLLDYLTVSVAFCGKAMLPAWKSNFRLLSTL